MAGSGDGADAATVESAVVANGTAEIVDYIQFVDTGGTAAIEIELTNTTTTRLQFWGKHTEYAANVTVTDGDGDGSVVLEFDTGSAGSDGTTFSTEADGDSVTVRNEATLDGSLQSVDLRVAAHVDGTETDEASVLVRDRSTATATTTATASDDAATATADGDTATATATDSEPTGTSTSSSSAPGFGVAAGLLALAGAALLARR